LSTLPPPGTYPTRPPGTAYPLPNQPAGKLRPSKLWVVVASTLLAVGVIVGIVIVAVGVVRLINSVANCDDCAITRAGSYDISPSKTGRYFIYQEGTGDRSAARERFDQLNVTLTDPTGRPVTIEPYSSSFTLSNNDVDLVAVAQFEVASKGTYHLTVENNGTQPVRLRFGTVAIGDLVRPIVIGVLAGGALFVGGAVLLIVTLVRRSRARKERQRQLGPPPGPVPWGGTGVTYPPPVPWGTPPLPPPGTWHPPQ